MELETSSIYQLIGKLGEKLITLCDVDNDGKKQLRRLFRKIAFTHLLKKSARTISENEHYTEDVGTGLYMLIVQQMAAKSKWTNQEYNHISSLIAKLDALLQEPKYPWASNICRVLVAVALNRQQDTSNCFCPLERSPKPFDGVFQIPTVFQPLGRFILPHSVYSKISTHDFLWSNFRHALPQLELTCMKDRRNSATSNFVELERIWFTSTGSPIDEGFSSPAIPDVRGAFDWSKLSIEPKVTFRQWETLGHNFSMHSESERTLAHVVRRSPYDLVKIDVLELMECSKAMLVGVSSHVFSKIGNKFVMIPGLYTEHTTPSLTFLYCKPLRDAGHWFLRLNEYINEYPCITSIAMGVPINAYISNYIGFVERLQTTNLLQLVLDWTPMIDQLEYLVTLLERKLSKWRLVQTLFDHSLQIADTNIFRISFSLLIDCCTVYFSLLSQWVFKGKYHDDLFFKQNIPMDEVGDRQSWQRAFSFSSSNAPSFLPSLKIFQCGRNNYLANLVIDGTCEENKPRFLVVTDYETCLHLKRTCKHYSASGEELYSTILDLLKRERAEKVSVNPANSTVFNSLQWRDEVIEAHEKRAAEKARLYSLFKQEMDNFRKHQRLKVLETKLQKLLEDDRLVFVEFQKVVADYSFRFDVIKRFLKEEERSLKKYLLNIWRAKRFSLNNLRQDFFKESQLISEEVDCSSYPTPSYLRSSDVISNSPSKYVVVDCLNSNSGSTVHSSSNSPTPTITTEQPSSPGLSVKLTSDNVGNIMNYTKNTRSREQTMGVICDRSQLSSFVSREDSNGTDELSVVNVGSPSSSTNDHFVLDAQGSIQSLTDQDEKSVHDQTPRECCHQEVTCISSNSKDQINLNHHGSVYNSLVNTYRARVTNDVLQPFKLLISYFTDNRRSDEPHCSSMLPNEADGQSIPTETYSRSHLHYFLRQSFDYPLNAQIQVMSNYVIHTLFKEHDLLGHLTRLKDIFLMHDGFKVMTLSNLLFENMSQKAPQNVLVYTELQNIVNFSCLSESDHFALKINHTVEVFDPLDPHLTSCLRLDYITTWPISLILTKSVLVRYDTVFSFHLSILRALWYMNKLHVSLMLRRMNTEGEHYKKVQAQRHVILHFLNSLRFYIGLTVSRGWETFLKVLCTVRNQDNLYAAHVKYLKGIYQKCMLSRQTQRIQDCLSMILRCVLLYCHTVMFGEWKHDVSNELLHTKFRKLCHLYNNFKSLVKSFIDLLEYFIKYHGFNHFTVLLLPIKSLPWLSQN